MTGATAVLFDAEDARRFLDERPAAARILALTPNARAPVIVSGLPVVTSRALYRSYGHRRSLARVRRAKPALMEAIERAGLSPSVAETLRGIFEMIGSMTARAHATLGTGPWLFPVAGGWAGIAGKDEAHVALLKRLAREPGWRPYRPAPAAALLNAINWLTASLLARRPCFLFCNADKGFADVSQELAGREPSIAIVNFQPATGTWRDVGRSCLGLWRALSGDRTVPMTVSPHAVGGDFGDVIADVVESVADPVLKRGLSVFSDAFIVGGSEAQSMQRPLKALIDRIGPLALLTYSLRWRFEAALGEAAGRCAVPRWLVSHGSHPVPDGAVAGAALDGHAEGLLVSRMADAAFPQSPQADRAAARLMPSLPRIPIRPAVWGHKIAGNRPAPVFRVLQAGTLKSWRDHRPWMYETSDEFVDGLTALTKAFQALGPEYELVIRVRAASECSMESLRALVPAGGNVSIRTDGNFLGDLAEADLLISHSSTTIEEALTARRPVLLFGGGCPYRHLSAETIPPTPDRRAPVYAVNDAAALSGMVAAIRDAHRGRPLTDAELADFIWPDTTARLIDGLSAVIQSGDIATTLAFDAAQPEKQNG